MTIEEYIDKTEPELINGVPFLLTDVNYCRDWDIEEKAIFDGVHDGKEYSFLERLQMARDEIEKDMKDNDITDIESAFFYYKERTEEGNSNYWGEMISIWTYEYDGYILYDVRMD